MLLMNFMIFLSITNFTDNGKAPTYPTKTGRNSKYLNSARSPRLHYRPVNFSTERGTKVVYSIHLTDNKNTLYQEVVYTIQLRHIVVFYRSIFTAYPSLIPPPPPPPPPLNR